MTIGFNFAKETKPIHANMLSLYYTDYKVNCDLINQTEEQNKDKGNYFL